MGSTIFLIFFKRCEVIRKRRVGTEQARGMFAMTGVFYVVEDLPIKKVHPSRPPPPLFSPRTITDSSERGRRSPVDG